MSADVERQRLAAVFHAAERLIRWAEAPSPLDHGRRRCMACAARLEGPPDEETGERPGHLDTCVVQDMRNALYGAVMSEDALHEAGQLAEIQRQVAERAGVTRVQVVPAKEEDKLGPLEVDQE